VSVVVIVVLLVALSGFLIWGERRRERLTRRFKGEDKR
jgi:uncharacterized iron-regulated membrane protein